MHATHMNAACARSTSRSTASRARPESSVTVSDGACPERTRAEPSGRYERRRGLRDQLDELPRTGRSGTAGPPPGAARTRTHGRIENVACTHAYALTGMFTRSVEGCPWSREDSRLGALTVNPGLPSLAYSRLLRGSLPPCRRSGGCVIAAGPIIRYPRVAACEQYQVPGGDDAGEVDDELEG
jgi:hypothetical protein